MAKLNISEELNPLCPMTSIHSHASGIKCVYGLTLRNPLSSKPSSREKLSELGQSMRGISLGCNGLDLSCDEYLKILNKLMKVKDLRATPSQERVLNAEQTIRFNFLIYIKSMV